jgi:glutamate transport system ATP-binding protein
MSLNAETDTPPPDTVGPIISMRGVSKRFGDHQVLTDIDLDIQRGEVIVVIGPSGSGKSTLCRTINRLEPISEGTILFDGLPVPVEGRELARRAGRPRFPRRESGT